MLKSCLLALWDTLVDELPGLVSRHLTPAARKTVRSLGKPQFLLQTERIYSVDDRVKRMPKEWAGHAHTKRVVVFHDADKAGPHIETYIEWKGQAYNTGVKRLNAERASHIKYNNKGELTNDTKVYLLGLLREEYEGEGRGSFLGQSTDHKPSEARESWTNRNPLYQGGYGSGKSRTVLADDTIQIWKLGNTIEGYDPLLSKHKDFYVHKIFDKGRTPVLKVGLKERGDIQVEDRLHLKSHVGKENYDRFKKQVGDGIITLKEDGASFHFRVDRHGFRAYSPRISKETGQRISYTHKLGDIRHVKHDHPIQGMGELLFIDTRTNRELKAHEVGGLLNQDNPIPQYYKPRLILYRIDRVDRKGVIHESYIDNLRRIKTLTSMLDDDRIEGPSVLDWETALKDSKHHEGLVGVPADSPISDGHKFKPRSDSYDWEVTKVELEPGNKGGIAGVVWFKNSGGKEYKIGASSMGNKTDALDIMNNPKKYVGRVAKIECFQGHEGRAAKFIEWHMDKGSA